MGSGKNNGICNGTTGKICIIVFFWFKYLQFLSRICIEHSTKNTSLRKRGFYYFYRSTKDIFDSIHLVYGLRKFLFSRGHLHFLFSLRVWWSSVVLCVWRSSVLSIGKMLFGKCLSIGKMLLKKRKYWKKSLPCFENPFWESSDF